MEKAKNKISGPGPQNENSNYNPANRDFQRTEDDPDDVSKSEKEELKKRKERTAKASTKPNRKRMN